MTTYLVATLARYVLVEAENEWAARELGTPKLHEPYADLRTTLGRDVPINICTVRPATSEETDLQRFHDEMVAREREMRRGKGKRTLETEGFPSPSHGPGSF